MEQTTSHRETTRRGFLAASCVMVASSRALADRQHEPEQSDRGSDQNTSNDNQPQHTETTGTSATNNDLEITRQTIAEAEKLAGVEFTDDERATIIQSIKDQPAIYKARREHALANELGPASVFDPRLPGWSSRYEQSITRRSADEPGPLPTDERDIAFAPVTQLSRWIESRQLKSEELTDIYLRRLKAHGPELECVITLTEDLARRQARRADLEIRAGRYYGPLHGIPWGAKDLFDTSGIRTTWGATPYKDRIAERDAAVVKRLDDAGAVLVAKTTLGALAYGDIWYNGRTNNPWNPKQGSSGSSAGSAAATAAGLLGFSLGTETLGSIVSPCMRCGTTGLRPTFGRVARSGAMALCWSLDKIGPICRTVEDTALVLSAINGADPDDPWSVDEPLHFDAGQSINNLTIGYNPEWFESDRARDIDRRVLETAERLNVKLKEIALPDMPYGALLTILMVEAAAAFEHLTLNDRDDELVWQSPRAWPNSFRTTWFTPAVEYVQAQRLRRDVMHMMHEQFKDIDVILAPSYAGNLLLITNNTGHPSLTIRAGFQQRETNDGETVRTPHGITLIGRLFDEGTLCNVGMALQRELNVWQQRPPMG